MVIYGEYWRSRPKLPTPARLPRGLTDLPPTILEKLSESEMERYNKLQRKPYEARQRGMVGLYYGVFGRIVREVVMEVAVKEGSTKQTILTSFQ